MNTYEVQCQSVTYLPGSFSCLPLSRRTRRTIQFGWTGHSVVRDRETGWYQETTPAELLLLASLGERQLSLDLAFLKRAWGRLTAHRREAIAATMPSTIMVDETDGDFQVRAADLEVWLDRSIEYHNQQRRQRAKEASRQRTERLVNPRGSLKAAKREWQTTQKEVRP